MKSSMRGGNEMTMKIQKLAKEQPERMARAEYQEAQIEATEMKRRTPVDTTPRAPHPGNLRNSIHVEEPEIRGSRVSTIIATGAQAPYAIYVHENPDAFHPVGEWKFMESVLNESAPYMNARLAARLHFDTGDK
jgi:hypothetical protein